MKLILTEKPSVAVDIAKSLGRFDGKDGYLKSGDYIVTWAYGHLLEIDDSVAPRRWDIKNLPVFPEEFKYKVIRSGNKQFKVIKELLSKADRVILASVSHDTPILIFEHGRPVFTTVGEFAERFFDGVGQDGNRHEVFLPDGYYCLSFDSSGRVGLHRIRGIVKHKASKYKLFRVTTAYGREIVASEHHSFFTLRSGKIRTVRTEELREGDLVLVPKQLRLPERKIRIDLVVEFLKRGYADRVVVKSAKLEKFLAERAFRRARIFFGKVAIFSEEQRALIKRRREEKGLSQAKVATLVGVRQSVISLFENGKSNLKKEVADRLLEVLDLKVGYRTQVDGRALQTLRLVNKNGKSRKSSTKDCHLLSKLDSEALEFLVNSCDDAVLYMTGTNTDRTRIPRYLELDDDFAFFLGCFVADGSINRKRGFIRIYLGTQKPFYSEVKERILRFLKRYRIYHSVFHTASSRMEEIRISSQVLSFVLSDVLKAGVRGVTGRRSEEKDIPDLLFVSPRSVRKAFVEGYLKSDGTPVGEGKFAVTTVSEKIATKLPYLSHSCGYPVVFTRRRKVSGGYVYHGHTVGYTKAKDTFGDLVCVPIKEVREIKYTHPWIYDLSVETDTEGNFVCGYGGICQHNTDAGREGELIARLILLHVGWKKWDRTYRLWTSEALTPEVVRRELNNLKPAGEFDSLYWCALARQHSDWIVGINLTRLVTLKSSDGSVWSVGRVQTPTLKLIVDRDTEIENFKPQPDGYW